MYFGVSKVLALTKLCYENKLVVQLKEFCKQAESSDPSSLMKIFKP